MPNLTIRPFLPCLVMSNRQCLLNNGPQRTCLHCCMVPEFEVTLTGLLIQKRQNQDAQTSAYFPITGYGQEMPSLVGVFMSLARHRPPAQTIAAVPVQKIAHSCEPWWLQTVASVPIRLQRKFSDWCIRRGKLNVPCEFWG